MLNGTQFSSDRTAIVSLDRCMIYNLYGVEAERIFSASASWLLTQCFTDVWPLVFNVIMCSQPTKTKADCQNRSCFSRRMIPSCGHKWHHVFFFSRMSSHIKCQRPGNGSRMVGKYKKRHMLKFVALFIWEKNRISSLRRTLRHDFWHLSCLSEFSCVAVMRLDMLLSPAPISSIYCPQYLLLSDSTHIFSTTRRGVRSSSTFPGILS